MPSAIRRQNCRWTSRCGGGRPGDRIGGLPVAAAIDPGGRPTHTPLAEVLRRPLESAQLRSTAFLRTIKNNGLTGSMGRVGACGDNAAMESFFALLQKNVLDGQRWTTREELRRAIITWIERTYHRRRRQRRLGRLTPVEYEALNLAATAA
jgi:transposase InsO family protein